jgi:hypothetical protein
VQGLHPKDGCEARTAWRVIHRRQQKQQKHSHRRRGKNQEKDRKKKTKCKDKCSSLDKNHVRSTSNNFLGTVNCSVLKISLAQGCKLAEGGRGKQDSSQRLLAELEIACLLFK